MHAGGPTEDILDHLGVGGHEADRHAAWAHRIHVDAADAYFDAEGRLRLSGLVEYQGAVALRLDTPHASIRVGARVLDTAGGLTPGLEARGGLAPSVLQPYETARFSMTLPRFDAGRGDAAVEIGLVCEGRFWFSEIGFPALRLAMGTDEASVAPPLPVAGEFPPPLRIEPVAVPSSAEAVELLYRALLARPADPEGLTHYAERLSLGVLDVTGVADALLGSAEFRDRAEAAPMLAARGAALVRGCRLIIPHDDPAMTEEPWPLRPYLDACAADAHVVDIGAGLGVYALPAAQRVGEAGRVHALEADPRKARLLAQSIALNGLDNVILLPLAAGDSLGYLRVSRRGGIETFVPGGRPHPADLHTHDLVPVTPLDLLLAASPRVDVIRIGLDVPSEDVLRGARTLLRAHRPMLFIACASRRRDRLAGAGGLLPMLRELGYGAEILRRGDEAVALGEDPVPALDEAWRADAQEAALYLRLTPLEAGGR